MPYRFSTIEDGRAMRRGCLRERREELNRLAGQRPLTEIEDLERQGLIVPCEFQPPTRKEEAE